MTADDGPTWRAGVTVPSVRHVPAFEDALEPFGHAVSSTERSADGAWRVSLYGDGAPDRDGLAAALAIAAAAAGIAEPELTVEDVPDVNWVAHVQRNSPPVAAGRFFVYGSHVARRPKPDEIGIHMDAGAAFGSGTHETTQGCLIALDDLSRDIRVGSALDMGCGSGILAIAIAKLWGGARIVAADNDPVSREVTLENAEINGVGGRIEAVVSQGFRNAVLRRAAPYDLIAANILARPLIGMAPALARHLAPGGVAVLSGLLLEQADAVSSAYRAAGLAVTRRLPIGNWATLVLGSGRSVT